MKILITCDRLDTMGGLEEHVTSKIEYLLKKGHIVHLDCNAISEYYKNKILHDNLTISSPWSQNWSFVMNDIKGFEPDIIHAHPFSAIERGYIVKDNFINAKFFVTLHGEYCYQLPNMICKKTDKIILVNNKIKGYENFNTVIIPNGIDTKKFKLKKYIKCDDVGKRTISIISRLQDDKEIPIFDFLGISNRLPITTHINIIGDGKYLDEIKEKTFNLNRRQNCLTYDVIGSISNVEEYMQQSDLVLGCDRVALEALCCGTDVFYMGQGHWKDLITIDNCKDYLFSNNEKKEYDDDSLLNRLINILNSKENLGIQYELYNKIRNEYSLDMQMEKILELYKD